MSGTFNRQYQMTHSPSFWFLLWQMNVQNNIQLAMMCVCQANYIKLPCMLLWLVIRKGSSGNQSCICMNQNDHYS